MECNIECVSWAIYWYDCKLTLFNLMSHVIVHKKIINKANANANKGFIQYKRFVKNKTNAPPKNGTVP